MKTGFNYCSKAYKQCKPVAMSTSSIQTMVSTIAPTPQLPTKEPEASGGMSRSSSESRKAQDKSESSCARKHGNYLTTLSESHGQRSYMQELPLAREDDFFSQQYDLRKRPIPTG